MNSSSKHDDDVQTWMAQVLKADEERFKAWVIAALPAADIDDPEDRIKEFVRRFVEATREPGEEHASA